MVGPADQIRARFKHREGQYEYAALSYVSIREDGQERFVRGVVRFTRTGDPDTEGFANIRADYGDLTLGRLRLSTAEALDVVDAVSRGEAGPHLPSPGLQAFSQMRVASGWYSTGWPPIGERLVSMWPAWAVQLTPKDNFGYNIRGPLVKRSLPPIVEVEESISRWIGQMPEFANESRQLVVVLPDFRCRIESVVIARDKVTVIVSRLLEPVEDVEYLAIASLEGQPEELNLPVAETGTGCEVVPPEDVTLVGLSLFVLSKTRDDLLDWVRIRPDRLWRGNQIRYDQEGGQYRYWLENGEGESVEFKQELSDGRRICRTIVALSNTKGGLIFLGVADDSSVIGTDLKKARRELNEAMPLMCDPVPKLTFEEWRHEGKEVLVIQVPKGSDRPYVFLETGAVLIRKGSTNRRATRAELDLFYRAPLPP
jgi:hypothetical protein